MINLRTCETCKKKVYKTKQKNYECIVLDIKTGTVENCFAWTDDPDWLKKVREAVKLYQNGKPIEN